MFPRISPSNNEWNRKYMFSMENGAGFLMEMKNGLAYFAWKFPDEHITFYKCEESVFHNNFTITEEPVEHDFDPYENISWLRYPVEI